MNTILLPSGFGDAMRRSTSLASFKDYRQAEAQNPQQLSVTLEGTLLEYETLELRCATSEALALSYCTLLACVGKPRDWGCVCHPSNAGCLPQDLLQDMAFDLSTPR